MTTPTYSSVVSSSASIGGAALRSSLDSKTGKAASEHESRDQTPVSKLRWLNRSKYILAWLLVVGVGDLSEPLSVPRSQGDNSARVIDLTTSIFI